MTSVRYVLYVLHVSNTEIAKQLRLILSAEDWRRLRVMAAERDTSMQALVAATMRREIATKREEQQ